MSDRNAWRDGYDLGVENGRRSMMYWLVFVGVAMFGVGFTTGYLW